MPMELLFALAQSPLPATIDRPGDIDRLRVLAAAELVTVRLPDVDSQVQKAEVLAISAQGRAALAQAYPGHTFAATPTGAGSAPALARPAWRPSLDTCRIERDASKTTLDS